MSSGIDGLIESSSWSIGENESNNVDGYFQEEDDDGSYPLFLFAFDDILNGKDYQC